MAKPPRYPKGHLIAAGALGAMLPLVFLLFPSNQAVATRHSTIEVDLVLSESPSALETPAADLAAPLPEAQLSGFRSRQCATATTCR